MALAGVCGGCTAESGCSIRCPGLSLRLSHSAGLIFLKLHQYSGAEPGIMEWNPHLNPSSGTHCLRLGGVMHLLRSGLLSCRVRLVAPLRIMGRANTDPRSQAVWVLQKVHRKIELRDECI